MDKRFKERLRHQPPSRSVIDLDRSQFTSNRASSSLNGLRLPENGNLPVPLKRAIAGQLARIPGPIGIPFKAGTMLVAALRLVRLAIRFYRSGLLSQERLYGSLGQEPQDWDFTGWTQTYVNPCGNPERAVLNPNAGIRVCSGSGAWDASDYAQNGQLAYASAGTVVVARFAGVVTLTGTTPIVARWKPGSIWQRANSPPKTLDQWYDEIKPREGSRLNVSFVATPYNKFNWASSVDPEVAPILQPLPPVAPAPRGFDKLPPRRDRAPQYQNRAYYYLPDPGQDPWENPTKPIPQDEVPNVHPPVYVDSGGNIGSPPIPPKTHHLAPPPKGTKERKTTSKWLVAGVNFFNSATEIGDFVDVLYDALPYHLKAKYGSTPYLLRSVPWKLKLQIIYDNFDSIDVSSAVEGYILNEIEDRLYAAKGKLANKAAKAIGKDRGILLTGGQPASYIRSQAFWKNVTNKH